MDFQYKNLKEKLEHVEVTEEEIDRQLERLRQQTPAITPVTGRPSTLGDELVLDYAGCCDGVAFEGGTAQNQTLTLGSGAFIPGFEEQLLGKNPGDHVTVLVTFPENYPHEALAGKPAKFECVVHEIRSRKPYDLDDTFAREVGRCESLTAMRETMRESLRQYYADRAEMELQDRLIRKAADTLDYQPTQAELDTALDEELDTLRAQLAQKGLTLADYCSFTGGTEQSLREELLPEAKQRVRIQATIEKIAELEQIRANAQDIADACESLCKRNHITMEQLDNLYDTELAKALERSVVGAKVLQFVRENAEIVRA